MTRIFRILSVVAALALLMGGLSIVPSQALDRDVRRQVLKTVVRIYATVEDARGGLEPLWWGSGTVVDSQGLILTNCHVAYPVAMGYPGDYEYDVLVIALTISSDEPARPTYLAEVAAYDPALDLAVIRVTHDLDGSPVDPENLDLPFTDLGDSDTLEVGDKINIFGYPGIGGETITFTSGNVSGFTRESGVQGRAWIKTDATIAGGNSGGTAVDEDGLLVGVPTQGGVAEEIVDARPVADTNGDGVIDGQDSAVPIGGFINALRPVKLALPLIEQARSGVTVERDKMERKNYTGGARLSRLFFASDINDFNLPVDVVTYLPSDSSSLYFFFDYEGMVDGVVYAMKTYINGQEREDWGLSPTVWSGGESGMWWIGWSDADFADAAYDLEVYVEDEKLAEASIEVGGRPSPDAAFRNVIFSEDVTKQDEPTKPGYLLPAGATEVYAFFDYENMRQGDAWTQVWYMDGEEAYTESDRWSEPGDGSFWISVSSRSGLAPGRYRLELYIEDELEATSDFWVVGDSDGEVGTASFDEVVFAEGVTRRGDPEDETDAFPSGTEEIHIFSDYDGMQDGLDFTEVWYIDDVMVLELPYEWEWGNNGTFYDYIYARSGARSDGVYRVDLVVEGQVLQSGEVTVGQGRQSRPPKDDEPQGVVLEGTIKDASTKRGIAGALFIVLLPDVSLRDFEWDESQVLAMAEADRQGYFELADPLDPEGEFSIVVAAKGYETIGGDGILIGDLAEELPLEIFLESDYRRAGRRQRK
ncbi:MAG: trypsin-like peptidase domain-containing protein [Anaerolineae bacterium]|nr:MAG: trypsin-like peptidase domain-containing protein [Anaerolineae bacterium]